MLGPRRRRAASDQPGSSARRFRAASRRLTKEIPTFISTWRSEVVSNVTKAPHELPVQERAATGPAPLHVPATEKGRLKFATKWRV